MASGFFASLPPRLSPAEENLRECLLRTATAAKNVLENSGGVSLQEWIEKRMPNQLVLQVGSGKMTIEPLQAGAAARGKGAAHPGKGATAKGAANSNGGKSIKEEAGAALEAFLSSLSPDSFSSQEESLREAIVNKLAKGPLQLTKVISDPQVSSVCRSFLPRHVPLHHWIKNRIGAEVSVEQGMCRLTEQSGEASANAAAEAGNEEKEAWLNELPADAFTQEEEELRDAIFDFLAGWRQKSKLEPSLPDAENDEKVQSASSKMLPQTVSLGDWIERRVGGEVQLPVKNGKMVIELADAGAKEIVAQKFQLLKKEEAKKAAAQKLVADANVTHQKFFEELPEDKLTEKELNLRQALLDCVDAWFKRLPNGPPPTLHDIMKDQQISSCKAALLPKSVFLKDWVEMRIGEEIHTSKTSNGQVIFFRAEDGHKFKTPPAEKAPPAQKAAGPAKGCAGKGGGKRAAGDTGSAPAERAGSLSRSEAFFASLPTDSFSEQEEQLREVLLDFLSNWRGTGPASLSTAVQDGKIRASVSALLPKGSALPTVKEWIDKRIGGEVETRDMGSEGILFAMRGELEDLIEKSRSRRGPPTPGSPGAARLRPAATAGAAAAGPFPMKRKADAMDGSACGGCKGKGKKANKGR